MTDSTCDPQVHFVGFRGDEYWSAVRVFGEPHFIHRGWDRRGQREISEDDTIVFANGAGEKGFSQYSYSDIDETKLPDLTNSM
jgi:hypothetical protein